MAADHARFYLAETISALESLHARNIIYRDLKPENIMLARDGHIKLIDFGFAKQLTDIKRDRLTTNCGTPSYTAPEVMMGQKYSYKCDIWSFGILMCELLGGFSPFSEGNNYEDYGPATELDPMQMVEIVNSSSLQLPKNLSAVARDLIMKLLVADPSTRYDVDNIKEHQFFKQIDWQKATDH